MLWADVLARTADTAATRAAARARLDAGQSMIGRAWEAFDQRQRNVPWWLRLCRDRAQWAVLSCTLRVCEIRAVRPDKDSMQPVAHEAAESGTTRDRVCQEFEADLRYGLEAIRAGLDGLLPVRGGAGLRDSEATSSPTAIQWKGFARQWLNLARATEAFDSHGPETYGGHWQRVNKAARMPNLYKSWVEVSKDYSMDEVNPDSPHYPSLFPAIVPPERNLDFAQLVDRLFSKFVAGDATDRDR